MHDMAYPSYLSYLRYLNSPLSAFAITAPSADDRTDIAGETALATVRDP